jgi:hypothetical protein
MKTAIARRRLMELTAVFAASSAVAHNVQAQAYPNRTIRLIAPSCSYLTAELSSDASTIGAVEGTA